jgi:deoxyribose-phosphate aldolase
VVSSFVQEVTDESIAPDYDRPLFLEIDMVTDAGSDLEIGTVVDFPEGKSAIDDKLVEAKKGNSGRSG